MSSSRSDLETETPKTSDTVQSPKDTILALHPEQLPKTHEAGFLAGDCILFKHCEADGGDRWALPHSLDATKRHAQI